MRCDPFDARSPSEQWHCKKSAHCPVEWDAEGYLFHDRGCLRWFYNGQKTAFFHPSAIAPANLKSAQLRNRLQGTGHAAHQVAQLQFHRRSELRAFTNEHGGFQSLRWLLSPRRSKHAALNPVPCTSTSILHGHCAATTPCQLARSFEHWVVTPR